MNELETKHFEFMLQAYRDRILAMKKIQEIRFGLAMKNSGRDAGASLKHVHSQIFGLTRVPEQVQCELDGAKHHFKKHGQCIYCGLVQQNLADDSDNSRVVSYSDLFVAWCPYASRFAYEVWLAPRQHASRYELAGDLVLRELAAFFRSIILKVGQHPRIHAFNYLLHSLPFDSNRHDEYHWHIEILPRTAKQAGFEWGTGVFINTVPPRQAARELRQLA